MLEEKQAKKDSIFQMESRTKRMINRQEEENLKGDRVIKMRQEAEKVQSHD